MNKPKKIYEETKEKIIGGSYEREEEYTLEKKKRRKKVEDAIAISTLDAAPPTKEAMELMDKYVDGEMELSDVLKETIEKYKKLGES